MDILMNRRSVRSYTDRPVGEDLISEILAAAMNAPSAGNEQPWQFIVVRDRSLMDECMQVHPYAKMLSQAPVAVIVCGDKTLETYDGFWVQDCAAATQNMLLAAVDKGLGAVWLGIHPLVDREKGFRKIFGIPEHVVPFAMVPLGWPAENPKPVRRFRADRIHRDKW